MSNHSGFRRAALGAGPLFLFLAVVLAPTAHAGTNTWTGGNGPSGPALGTMLVTATSPARIYVAARFASPDGGMGVSTDGGLTFDGAGAANLPAAVPVGLGAVAGTPTTLLAAMGNFQGVWKSTDGAATWALAGLSGNGLRCLTTDPADAQVAFAGAALQLFRTTDQGGSWLPVSPVAGSATTAVAVDPTAHLKVYAGFQNANRFYASTDGGVTWSPRANLPSAPNVLRVDATAPSTLYAGIASGLYKSTDGGAAWTASGLAGLTVRDVAIDPGAASTLLAGTSTGLFRSTDAGASWAPAAGSLFTGLRVNALVADPSTAGLFLATTEAGLFRSTDHGAGWAYVEVGLPAAPWSVAGDTASASAFYMGTVGGFYRSTDNGATFADRSAGLPDRRINAILTDPADPLSVLVGTGTTGIQRSTNAGLTWAPANTGLASLVVNGLARDPVTASLVYVATAGGVFRSTDSGASWTLPSADLDGHGIAHVAIDPVTTSTLYAGNAPEATALLWKSTNGGTSWQELTAYPGKSDGSSTTTWRVLVSPSHTLWAGTDTALYRSTDGGASFANVTAGLASPFIDDLVLDAASADGLIVATDGGVFRTTDLGAHWAPLMSGLDEVGGIVQTLARSPVRPSTLVAGVINAGAFIYRFIPQGMNQLRNSGFGTDVSGWFSFGGGGFEWSSLDAGGNASSGSALVSVTTPGARGLGPLAATTAGIVQDCSGVTPRDRVNFSTKVFIPTGQPTTGDAGAAVTWYSDPFCQSMITTSGTPVTPTGVWMSIGLVHQTPPPGTRSAVFALFVRRNEASGTFQANFDDAVFRLDLHGDANADGLVNVTDVFYLINYLFAGGPAPIGPPDANGDSAASVSDVFYLINYLFAGGPPPV